jgi:hypothetical protein
VKEPALSPSLDGERDPRREGRVVTYDDAAGSKVPLPPDVRAGIVALEGSVGNNL